MTPKKKIRKKNRIFFGFSLFLTDFAGARDFLTSKSDSSRYFASDGQTFRYIERLEWSEAKITAIDPPTTAWPQATGKGREGLNPPQDWGFVD